LVPSRNQGLSYIQHRDPSCLKLISTTGAGRRAVLFCGPGDACRIAPQRLLFKFRRSPFVTVRRPYCRSSNQSPRHHIHRTKHSLRFGPRLPVPFCSSACEYEFDTPGLRPFAQSTYTSVFCTLNESGTPPLFRGRTWSRPLEGDSPSSRRLVFDTTARISTTRPNPLSRISRRNCWPAMAGHVRTIGEELARPAPSIFPETLALGDRVSEVNHDDQSRCRILTDANSIGKPAAAEFLSGSRRKFIENVRFNVALACVLHLKHYTAYSPATLCFTQSTLGAMISFLWRITARNLPTMREHFVGPGRDVRQSSD